MMRPRLPVIAGLAVAAVLAAAAAALYDRLPGAIPTHWGLDGRANGWVAKPWGPFVYPLMAAGMAALGWLLPVLSPRGFGVSPFARAFDLIVLALVAIPAVLMAFVIAQAFGVPTAGFRLAPALIGLVLVAIGNVMGKTTRNFFIGVRTPWTLTSPEVWSRTHRLAGRLFVAAGLVFILGAAVGLAPRLMLAVVVAAALVPVAYSYWLYRRLELRSASADTPLDDVVRDEE